MPLVQLFPSDSIIVVYFCINIFVARLIVMMLSADIFGYFIVSIMFTVLSGLMLCEALIAVSSTPREVYVSYSGVVAVQFLFSGLLIKSSTMPDWLSPWVPSISVIRWAMQVRMHPQIVSLFLHVAYFLR